MDSDRQKEILTRAMNRTLSELERMDRGFYAMANIIAIMAKLRRPEYLPLMVKFFLWESGLGDERSDEVCIKTVSAFGDQVFPLLEPIMDQIPSTRLIDVLTVVRQVATPEAEAFLVKHLDRFMAIYRNDTLEACQSLVSEKALDRMTHKVGKGQTKIDALFVLVKTFRGESGPETEKLLDEIHSDEKAFEKVVENTWKNSPQPVLKLELECTRCGDISYYPCRNIILSPNGDAYVAEELTCIVCDQISEFKITALGVSLIQLEGLRILELENSDEAKQYLPGAIKFLSLVAQDKEMSINDSITLYKKKIKKYPQKPENYISLGNIYKSQNQYFLAEEQYAKAVKKGPFYIESYLSLAFIAEEKGKFNAALDWLEKGRSFLRRPLICKVNQNTDKEIMDAYQDFHTELLRKTGVNIPAIQDDEFMTLDKSMRKIGRNEKCPCGSGKKYKKCCIKKR